MQISATLRERFYAKVRRVGTCDEWSGVTNNTGYGMISIASGVSRPAHRVAWFLARGVWPKDCLLHSCDNRRCVTLEHMREGTKAENNKDAATRRRHHYGIDHHNGKLTDEQIKEIVVRRAAGAKLRELADTYNVSETTISRVYLGKARK